MMPQLSALHQRFQAPHPAPLPKARDSAPTPRHHTGDVHPTREPFLTPPPVPFSLALACPRRVPPQRRLGPWGWTDVQGLTWRGTHTPMEKADKKRGRFFYGWVVVGISGVVFAVVRGVNESFGLFLVAFVAEFGWSRAAVAGAFSFARAVEGAVSAIIGMLSDRLGVGRHRRPLVEPMVVRPHRQLHGLVQPLDGRAHGGHRLCVVGGSVGPCAGQQIALGPVAPF